MITCHADVAKFFVVNNLINRSTIPFVVIMNEYFFILEEFAEAWKQALSTKQLHIMTQPPLKVRTYST